MPTDLSQTQDYQSFAKKYPYIAMGFEVTNIRSNEVIGDCLFCGKDGEKLHVNKKSGLFDCKSCGKQGNVTDAMNWFYGQMDDPMTNPAAKVQLIKLSENREISVELLLKYLKIKYDKGTGKFVIPVYNSTHGVVNLRFVNTSKGIKTMAMSGCQLSLGGYENLGDDKSKPVYICEGEWDYCALCAMFAANEREASIVYCPGAGTFKRGWEEMFVGRDVTVLFDNDEAGFEGREKVCAMLQSFASKVSAIYWEEGLQIGFDVRDLYKRVGLDLSSFDPMIRQFKSRTLTVSADGYVADFPHVSERTATFADTVAVFNKYLRITEPLKRGLKIMYAVTFATQIDSPPLWIHVVSPPGSGKTEMAMTMAECENVRTCSTVTAKSLVSGFNMAGKDPSLIPQIIGKTLIIKDFTEILGKNVAEKEEVDSILRGAYDGSVTKQFGNGVTRSYYGQFNIISGVTQEIFRESQSSMGDRWLLYHMIQGVNFDVEDVIKSALLNVGRDSEMKRELTTASQQFVQYTFTRDDVNQVSEEKDLDRIIAVSQLVGSLRATVARDPKDGTLLYRPQHEVGTRVAKQLHTLLIALSVCNPDLIPLEEDWEIVMQIAANTCKGFNFEIAEYLFREGEADLTKISEETKIPPSSVRKDLEDLVLLEHLQRRTSDDIEDRTRRPKVLYGLTPFARKLWERSGIAKARRISPEKPRGMKVRFRTEATKTPNAAMIVPQIPPSEGGTPVVTPL